MTNTASNERRLLKGVQWTRLDIWLRHLWDRFKCCDGCGKVAWGFFIGCWSLAAFYISYALLKHGDIAQPGFWVVGANAAHVQSVALTIGGLIFAPFLVWRVCIANRQVAVAQRDLDQSEKTEWAKLIASRYERAVELLGTSDPSTKLGAIFALGDIAKDSEGHRRAVAETLTAWLRGHRSRTGSAGRMKRADLDSISSAIVTMLNAMFSEDMPPPDSPLNLSNTDLTWARFRNLPLVGAQLQGADLSGMVLSKLKMDNADLTGANLYGAYLQDTSISGLILDQTQCKGMHLERTKFQGLIAREVEFIDAHLYRTEMLDGTRLDGVNLTGEICREADFSNCNLSRAIFDEASILSGADFKGATLTDAHLEGVDLSEARNLTPAQLESASGDTSTKLPPDVDRIPDTWYTD